MASATDIAKRYFKARDEHDLDTAAACWAPGAVDRLVGEEDLIAPAGVTGYFQALFAAFLDFSFEVLDTTTDGNRVAVRWRARGTFAGPGEFRGFEPNISTEKAGDSIRKLAELEPSVVWTGHAEPVRGDVAAQLREVAASAA